MKSLRLEILDEVEELSVPSSRSSGRMDSPVAVISSETEESKCFFVPPGVLISNRDSVVDTEGSTQRSGPDEIFEPQNEDDANFDPTSGQIICYEEFVLGPEPPAAPKSRKTQVFQFTDEMFEETGSTSARVRPELPTGSTSARRPEVIETVDPRDAEIERLKAQLAETRDGNSAQISSLIRQNELLTMLNCNLTNENKQMSVTLKTTSNDVTTISKDHKLAMLELKQTKEITKEQSDELSKIWKITNEIIGDDSPWNSRSFKQISSKLEIVKSRQARVKVCIENLKDENTQLKQDLEITNSKHKVLQVENKKLKLNRPVTAKQSAFQARANRTERLEGKLRNIISRSPDSNHNERTPDTSFNSGHEGINTSYTDARRSPLKQESKLFSKYMPKNYAKIRSVSRDKFLPKAREPVLNKRRI